MSVVNKMLRDLESRKHQQEIGANYVPEKNYKPIILVGIALLVSLSLAATYTMNVVMNQEEKEIQQDDVESKKKLQPGDRYALSNESKEQEPIRQVQQLKSLSPIKNIKLDLNESTDIKLNAYAAAQLPAGVKEKERSLIGPPKNQLVKSNLDNNTDKRVQHQPSTIASVSIEKPLKNIERNEVSINDEVAKPIAKEDELAALSIQQPSSFTVKPSKGGKQQLSNLRAEAHIASNQGDDRKVIESLQHILVISPSDQRTRKQLAALLFSKAKLDEAAAVLETGISIAPAESSLRLMLARTYFKAGDKARAFNVLSEHPYKQLATDELLSFRAGLAEKLGNYPDAEIDYQLLVKRNPSEAKWWLGLGVAQDKQKLAAQAINSYQQAKALNQLPQQVDSFVSKRIQLLARES